MHVGDQVVARKRIEEDGFLSDALFIHAEPGDRGEVVDVADLPDWYMIAWSATGFVTECHRTEFSRLAAEQEAQPSLPQAEASPASPTRD